MIEACGVRDDLPDLSDHRPLLREEVESFRQKGHVLLRGIATRREIESYRPVLVEAVRRRVEASGAMERVVHGGSKSWNFVDNLWRDDPSAAGFTTARRFAAIAADLLGVDAVRLFRDQAYFKQSGGGNTPWHQDGYFMPLDSEQVITMWIPLVDITPDMAPMQFFDGSHRGGYLGTSTGEDESMDEFEAAMARDGYSMTTYDALAVGDASFHSGWTLHGSRSNVSRRTREAVVIVYYADGARVGRIGSPPANPSPQEFFAERIRRRNLAECLPGLKIGDLAVTEMNPLLFRRGDGRP